MYILGLNCYMHDSSACLIKDGAIVAFAEEERFIRKKHCSCFPREVIRYCLKQGGININDIEYVAFFWKPWKGLLERFIQYLPYSLHQNPHRLQILKKMLTVKAFLRSEMKYRNKFYYIDHHKAHAANAFYVSPFKKAAFLVIDCTGEISSTTMGKGKDVKISIIKEIKYPHSLGLLYLCVTEYLGFKEIYEEGKVMALAAYGRPCYLDRFRKIVNLLPNGEFALDMSYFDHHLSKKNYISRKFIEMFGPRRSRGETLEQRHMDIAASLQKTLEEAVFHIVNFLYNITQEDNLCLSGGVALNCAMNGKLFKNTPFKRIFVQPAANDAGTSLGAALYLCHNFFNNSQRRYVMNDVYYGPEYTEDGIKDTLDAKRIKYQYVQDIASVSARLISKGKIIGWFQGRMEAGPRALGNRSILADPRDAKMKDYLNRKVKHRERFRPFAASVLEEEVFRFFDIPQPSPHMLFAFQVLEEKKKEIPAVIHIDGTSRIQTVNKEDNPLFWELLKNFEGYTGIPVILNTSFNTRGEPIVCTPSDALDCFCNSDMDYLAMGNFLAGKDS